MPETVIVAVSGCEVLSLARPYWSSYVTAPDVDLSQPPETERLAGPERSRTQFAVELGNLVSERREVHLLAG